MSLDECYKSLKSMKNNKSPGSDGLTKEFYVTLWDTLGADLVDIFNTCYLREELTETNRNGQITLLYKKNDPRYLKTRRPISLMYIDYKVLSKTLTQRLKKVMGILAHNNQACRVGGRTIYAHLLYIKYLQEYINCRGNKRPGTNILCIDQEKVFNRVEHKMKI